LTRLSNGSCVEWVRDVVNPLRIRLLVVKDGRPAIQDEVEHDHRVLRAPALDPNMAKALYLPNEILPGRTFYDRIAEIVTILRRHTQMADQHYLLAASFSLSTWFPDRVDVFPYLAIIGPTGSGKQESEVPKKENVAGIRRAIVVCRRPRKITSS